jgi:hypothetical protein
VSGSFGHAFHLYAGTFREKYSTADSLFGFSRIFLHDYLRAAGSLHSDCFHLVLMLELLGCGQVERKEGRMLSVIFLSSAIPPCSFTVQGITFYKLQGLL